MHSIVIAENLTNDFCNPDSEFSSNRVNIGATESARLFGEGAGFGTGILPRFLEIVLEAKQRGTKTGIVFIRDQHEIENDTELDEFVRFGDHCIRGTLGAEFITPVLNYLDKVELINTSSIAIPLEKIQEAVLNLTGIDLLSASTSEKLELSFLITGVHTERMIFNTAYLIRNVLGCQNVAVCPHLVGSTSREAHFSSLRNSFPDALIRIMPDIIDAVSFLGIDSSKTHFAAGSACLIEPAEIFKQFTPEQKMICEVLCMHWTFAHLTPLSGGFSGSMLYLAQGWKDATRTEPMVIKIDKHEPIRREWDGYERVNDLLGKNIPTLNPPVTFGAYTGVSMDLASMEGHPKTLQSHFENADCDQD